MSSNPKSLFRKICEFSKSYPLIHGGLPVGDPRTDDVLANLKSLGLHVATALKERGCTGFETVVSEGHGAFPRYTWICFLPPRQKVSEGVYAGICFDGKGSGALVGCMRSVTSKVITLETLKRSRDAKKRINVGDFNDAFINPEEYFVKTFSFDDLADHLAKSLVMAGTIVAHAPTNSAENCGMTSEDKNNFVAALQKCGFVAEGKLPGAFLQSLISKPFVILTGNSGTGKTKIAELLAAWLRGNESDGHELVAVGADWTDNRNVVGFVNYLRISEDGKTPVYQSTHLLDLLMRARGAGSKPFFLILDEMNLSHVERYFADFLSAMESKAAELDLHSEGGEAEQLPVEPGGQAVVPRKLSIPSNVFVIGTVNVDETTYMFSPKVLDRANVIEFRMPDGAVKSFLAAGESRSLEIEYAGDGVAERFLSLSREARADQLHDPGDAAGTKDLAEALDGVFAIMRDARLEFGFRTINEVRRYVRVDYALTGDQSKWRWKDAFDTQLLQKILPKLSGSRRRLEDLLVRLAVFCEFGKVPPLGANMPAHLQSVPVKRIDAAVFRQSYRKLCDMLDAVRRDQFVSFIQ